MLQLLYSSYHEYISQGFSNINSLQMLTIIDYVKSFIELIDFSKSIKEIVNK